LGLLAIAASACSSSGAATTRPPQTTKTTTLTTNTTTTTEPEQRPKRHALVTAAYGFDDTLPLPKLDNTGADYTRALNSLLDYGDWLYAFHPDPALVATECAPSSECEKNATHDMATLRATRHREYEIGRGHRRFVAVTVKPDLVSGRLTEYIGSQRLVTASGKTLFERTLDRDVTYLAFMAKQQGRWLLVALDETAQPGQTA
jgi:hypothetical protein